MKKIKKIYPYIINVILVLGIFLTCLFISKTYPFGNNTIGKSDGIVIFKPMLYNFITSIKEGILEPFSFNNGLGNPIIFNFLYHFSSPLNAIAFLFNDANAMYLSTILLKLALTAITVTFYTKKKTNNNFLTTITSLTYVFSSWLITYYYYLPWLDVFLIFPLFQYGLEELLKGKKCYFYIFTLSFTLISNFYLAFPVCIYTIIYFILFNIYNKSNKKDLLNLFNKIFINTFIAFLLSAFYIYALYNSYLKMGITFSDTISTEYSLSFLDFIKSLFYGNTILTVFEEVTFPNIAVNSFALLNLFYYFVNKNITKKEKLFSIIIIVICIAAFFIKQFDFVLNFFHNIRGLTYRYSFIPCFLMIIPIIRNYQTLNKDNNKKWFHIISVPIFILLFINYKNMEFEIFIFNIVFLLAFNILVLFYTNNKLFKILIALLLISQTTIATYNAFSTPIDKSSENIPNNFNTETTTYRLNKVTDNNEEYLNYNLYSNTNVTYLLSAMTYNRIFPLAESIGCQTGLNTSISCSDNNEIATMLLNVKNDYYLEKLFSVNSNILNIDLNPYNVKNTIENIIYAMTDISDIYDTTTLKGTLKEDGKYYYSPNKNFYLIDFEDENGETINFVQTYTEFISDSNKKINIYTINEEKLKEIHQALSKNQINYTNYSDSSIEGTINVENNQIIFTSIPYDSSWQITIDGKKVKPIMVLDSLLGIEVEAGDHTIKLQYKNNFIIPIIISLTTFLFLIISIIKSRKKDIINN